MLKRCCEQPNTIALYGIARSLTDANLTKNKWQLAEMLASMLKHFETATKVMNADNACTPHIIPFVCVMKKFLDDACDTAPGIKTSVNELNTEFNRRLEKYKDNNELKIAMVLDPSFKLKFVQKLNHIVMQ